jgi:hypothetical protein
MGPLGGVGQEADGRGKIPTTPRHVQGEAAILYMCIYRDADEMEREAEGSIQTRRVYESSRLYRDPVITHKPQEA